MATAFSALAALLVPTATVSDLLAVACLPIAVALSAVPRAPAPTAIA